MDSKLVIEQMAGRWKIKHPDMRPLAIQAQRLAPFGTQWTWVPREQNKAADRLANLAMDRAKPGGASYGGEVYDAGAARPTDNQPGDPTPDAMEPPSPGMTAERRRRARHRTRRSSAGPVRRVRRPR